MLCVEGIGKKEKNSPIFVLCHEKKIAEKKNYVCVAEE
jgi:hypothetical protein